MKKILQTIWFFVFFFFFIGGMALAQNLLPRTYDYDEAGNRVLRTTVEVRHAKVTENTNNSQTELTNTRQNIYFEEALGQFKVKVFPNPTYGQITLLFDKNFNNGKYQLFNLSGKLLEEGKLYSARVVIDLSDYQTGVYMLTLKVDTLQETWKIIKK